MGIISKIWQSLVNLIYPNLCEVCGEALAQGERLICSLCMYEMPLTYLWKYPDNSMKHALWKEVKIENACSLFYFRKKSLYRPLIHKLKYKGMYKIGILLGEELGKMLVSSVLYTDIDYIVPVPMHPRKERARGYNQCDYIAAGLSSHLHVPVLKGNLIKTVRTKTQTRLGRLARRENVSSVFDVKNPEEFNGKHVLLVDDVITTGATLEACAKVVLRSKNCRVSVATLAITSIS